MIKIEHTEVLGWEHAIRGMRNPMNSWEKSDSGPCMTHGPAHCIDCPYPEGSCDGSEYDLNRLWIIGPNDLDLMLKLVKAGTDHAKFRRMITVYVDLTAPLYWWSEAERYGINFYDECLYNVELRGNLIEKPFELEDFSYEQLSGFNKDYVLKPVIDVLNTARHRYIQSGLDDEEEWQQIVQLLPSSYNLTRTVIMNYEQLGRIYKDDSLRLNEWVEFCKWIETLPYCEIIFG